MVLVKHFLPIIPPYQELHSGGLVLLCLMVLFFFFHFLLQHLHQFLDCLPYALETITIFLVEVDRFVALLLVLYNIYAEVSSGCGSGGAQKQLSHSWSEHTRKP